MSSISNKDSTISSAPESLPYFSSTARNKVDNIALGCFEALAHWFLTTFSCVYPAYDRFYQDLLIMQKTPANRVVRGNEQYSNEEISVETGTSLLEQPSHSIPPALAQIDLPNPASAEIDENPGALVDALESADLQSLENVELNPFIITQTIRDQDLMALFSILMINPNLSQEGYDMIQNLTQSDSEVGQKAEAIRSWMKDHSEILNKITKIIFVREAGAFYTLPPEIMLFPNLEELWIDAPMFTELPENFNPKLLKQLVLSNTNLTALPTNFNPPSLRIFKLANTPISSLPEAFHPKYLWLLDLSNTKIAFLPSTFDSPLSSLRLDNTPITALPESLVFEPLGTLTAANTNIQSISSKFQLNECQWPQEIRHLIPPYVDSDEESDT